MQRVKHLSNELKKHGHEVKEELEYSETGKKIKKDVETLQPQEKQHAESLREILMREHERKLNQVKSVLI